MIGKVRHSFSCSNQRKFCVLKNQDCVFSSSSADPRLLLHLVSCRTKPASSVRLLQNQDYVFISAAAELRLRLQFVLCRTMATALFRCLQNQYCVLILSSAEPVPPIQFVCRTKTMSSVRPLQNNGHCFISVPAEPILCLNFVFCRTNTTSSVCLQNQDCVFSSFSSFYIHQSRESFLTIVNSSAIRKVPRTLWSPKFCHHVHKSPPRVCILSQMNSVHIIPSCGVRSVLPLPFSFSSGFFSPDLPAKHSMHFYSLPRVPHAWPLASPLI